jgi:hypothetical protein
LYEVIANFCRLLWQAVLWRRYNAVMESSEVSRVGAREKISLTSTSRLIKISVPEWG